jgi:hypothetical protein
MAGCARGLAEHGRRSGNHPNLLQRLRRLGSSAELTPAPHGSVRRSQCKRSQSLKGIWATLTLRITAPSPIPIAGIGLRSTDTDTGRTWELCLRVGARVGWRKPLKSTF